MAQRTNQKSTKNSSTAKNPPNKPNDGLTKDQRRARNLKLREDAKAKAKAAGLPWDETIRAAEFHDDFDKAFTAATTSPNAKPIEDAPTVVVTPKTDDQLSTAELLKKAKETILPSDETRNGEPPTEAATEEAPVAETEQPKKMSRKERRKAEALARAAKDASVEVVEQKATPADAALKNFADTVEAITEANTKPVEHALVDEQPEGEQHVDESLVEHGSFAAADAAEQEKGTDETTTEQASQEESATPTPDVEQPAADGPAEDSPAEPAQEAPAEQAPITEVPVPVQQPVVEAPEQPATVEAKKTNKKPTLTVVSDNPNDPKLAAAKEFYGDACTPSRAKLLAEALMWLNKAIVFEKAGEKTKTEMAFKAALKKEAEAFAGEMALAA